MRALALTAALRIVPLVAIAIAASGSLSAAFRDRGEQRGTLLRGVLTTAMFAFIPGGNAKR